MKKVLTIAGVTVMALSLGTGVVSAQHGASGELDTTGPRSNNVVDIRDRHDRHVNNNNNLELRNNSDQDAESGDASSKYNTEGGAARTGDAYNDNATGTDVTVRNSGHAGAAASTNGGGDYSARLHKTGPESNNEVHIKNSHKVRVNNNNNVKVENNSRQEANSGDAHVYGNTEGGSARSGDAENVNTTVNTVTVRND